ncbi:DUF1656 domain-containing protein [Acuticoccus sp. I52.16.1]|uniref:DUF1656 domain-containing protein n=1 Tax=Acuticoccus sp. I52.16.1 TaxID=2928472 RepID=UPI001FD3056A|nr:DUF1656 domain-containing protein [Acuticoccus sp. I52.16.1]UOM35367.1 DUF1656 domain-containing protein [Acuticoccus sp. I52.16.1]
MHHELAFIGMLYPSLLACAVAAALLWYMADALMLRLGLWRFFFHPPLARLSLYVVTLGVVAWLTPDF